MPGCRIGIAGYMGAGKSIFAGFFKGAGFTVIDADAEAKSVMAADAGVRRQLRSAFGDDTAPGSGIDSLVLGSRVFASAANLARLNEIVRPLLARHFGRRLEELAGSDTVLDAAMLPLWDTGRDFRGLFWVRAPHAERLKRLMAKYRTPTAYLENRMRLQASIMAQPPASAWTMIENNATIAALESTAQRWIDSLRNEQGRSA